MGGSAPAESRRLLLVAEQRTDPLPSLVELLPIVAGRRIVDRDSTLVAGLLFAGRDLKDAVAVEREIENDRIAGRLPAEAGDAELADLNVLQGIAVLALIDPNVNSFLLVAAPEN